MQEVRRLTPAHVAEYREIMLEGYASQPEAFTSTVPEREPLSLDWWESRLSDRPDSTQLVLGAFVEDRLVGVVGLSFATRVKTRHKSLLFGLFVRSGFTGRGIGRELVEAALEHARLSVETRVVQLTVTASNRPAIQLYESCGFRPFGTEPWAIRNGGRFQSKIHMWCPVGSEDP